MGVGGGGWVETTQSHNFHTSRFLSASSGLHSADAASSQGIIRAINKPDLISVGPARKAEK